MNLSLSVIAAIKNTKPRRKKINDGGVFVMLFVRTAFWPSKYQSDMDRQPPMRPIGKLGVGTWLIQCG
jgi:hypothetical protein